MDTANVPKVPAGMAYVDGKAAEGKAEITFERPGVVINMPFVTWPDGRR